MTRRRFLSSSLGLGAAGLLYMGSGQRLTPLATQAPLYPVSGAALAFGTTISMEVMHGDTVHAQQAVHAALDAAMKIDHLMSLYRPDSQLAILNRNGILDQPDAHLLAVLRYAHQLSVLTEGAFDVTVQPLWQAFAAASATQRLPSQTERGAAMALVGWRDLQIDAQRIRLRREGMAVTLNGLAQGYALDVAQGVLAQYGIAHALVDAGEFGASGRRSVQHAWTVGIRDPRDRHGYADILTMQGRSVATSGDYETVFSPDFLHHHIFDPSSGDSPTELASVTVIAPTGLQADGLSTACMVLGAQKSQGLIAGLADTDILMVAKDGRRWCSAQVPSARVPLSAT